MQRAAKLFTCLAQPQILPCAGERYLTQALQLTSRWASVKWRCCWRSCCPQVARWPDRSVQVLLLVSKRGDVGVVTQAAAANTLMADMADLCFGGCALQVLSTFMRRTVRSWLSNAKLTTTCPRECVWGPPITPLLTVSASQEPAASSWIAGLIRSLLNMELRGRTLRVSERPLPEVAPLSP